MLCFKSCLHPNYQLKRSRSVLSWMLSFYKMGNSLNKFSYQQIINQIWTSLIFCNTFSSLTSRKNQNRFQTKFTRFWIRKFWIFYIKKCCFQTFSNSQRNNSLKSSSSWIRWTTKYVSRSSCVLRSIWFANRTKNLINSTKRLKNKPKCL